VLRIQTIILDFDGVIVESNAEKTRAFDELFALYPAHRNAMMAYHAAHLSEPRRPKLEHCVSEIMGRPGDDALVELMLDQFSRLVVRRVVAAPEVAGARIFFEEFSPQVPLYLASLTPETELRQILRARRLDVFFANVYGDPPVDKPAAIRDVLLRERVSASAVLFVGDSPSDYAVAREAGLQFLARDSGLPWDGLDVEPHRDLGSLAAVVRGRIGAP
jgi:phosphoglycolate phosphatase-like HAD superfamily hydrolase